VLWTIRDLGNKNVEKALLLITFWKGSMDVKMFFMEPYAFISRMYIVRCTGLFYLTAFS